MGETAGVDALPVIDLGLADGPAHPPASVADDRADPRFAARAAEVDRACRATGFFLVSGHGVPAAAQRRLDTAAREFFALPDDVKATVAMARGGRRWRGWFPEGGELTAGRPDHKEGLYLGADLPVTDPRVQAGLPLHGPNLLPDAAVADLRPAVDDWMRHLTALGHRLLRLVAAGLGLAPDWFEHHLTADPTTLFRIFRYPARPAADDGWGVAEHTDYGLLTILAHDGRPGLQVHGPAGWFDVPSVPDTFVVNLGDMLDRLTGGRYRSTPHRVRHVATPEAGDRLSFPFFFDPSWDALPEPLPLDGVPPADDAADRWDATSVHHWSGPYGAYLTAKVARVFPALAPDLT